MSVRARLFDQFRRPRGVLGVLAGRVMAKRSSNRQRSAWTVELLDVQPDDRVLELGYGPGLGIEAALGRLQRGGRLVGLDHSDTMRTMATRRVRGLAAPVVPELLVGDVQSPPDDLDVFDKIFSCNVWLFWSDPVAVLTRLHAHLAPGGTIAVTHLPRHGGADPRATLAAAEAIEAQLRDAGYAEIRREVLDLEPAPAVCVLARG